MSCFRGGAVCPWHDSCYNASARADVAISIRRSQVDRSNAERASESEKMLAAIRSKSQQYSKQAEKAPGLLS